MTTSLVASGAFGAAKDAKRTIIYPDTILDFGVFNYLIRILEFSRKFDGLEGNHIHSIHFFPVKTFPPVC